MIRNFNAKERRNDTIILSIIIMAFIFLVWVCTPPGNKFIQLAFWGSNTRLLWAKLTDNAAATEWMFHRNNAVYLAKMKNKDGALLEMDRAIKTFPSYQSDAQLKGLYRDRAVIRMYYGDYKGALDDYLKSGSDEFMDRLRIALLFKEVGNYKGALSYCNSIIAVDSTAYAGFACLASVYEEVGRYKVSVRVYDLLISRSPNKAKYYADRAMYKKKAGDIAGYDADMAKAKELSSVVDTEYCLIEDTLNPKIVQLTAMPIR